MDQGGGSDRASPSPHPQQPPEPGGAKTYFLRSGQHPLVHLALHPPLHGCVRPPTLNTNPPWLWHVKGEKRCPCCWCP